MNQVLTDIHQHLIWGMDDGANSRETMFSMLREAHRQGIKTIVATSHAEPGFQPFDIESYTERLAEAQDFCKSENLDLQVLRGAEIAWTYQTPMALRQGRVPTIGGTDYVLIELWRDISWQAATDAANQLTRAGYCPVLAHPERYLAFLWSPKKALRFRHETGTLLQVNANTILHPRNYWERRFTEYAGIVCRVLGIKYIPNITGLGTPVENSGKLQFLATRLYKYGVAGSDTIFFQNEENVRFFEQHHMMSKKSHLCLLPGSGVNLQAHPELPYSPGDVVHFLFVARLLLETM